MWSDRYTYYSIYKDSNLSVSCDAKAVRVFLAGMPELKADGPNSFLNNGGSFLSIALLSAKRLDSWSDRVTEINEVNLIAVVGTKGDENEERQNLTIMTTIAHFLDWQLVEDEA